ncbi:MAG: histone, partial [Simkaniaceae bacterium]|nr:histone [Simkaniaceae bacterium]
MALQQTIDQMKQYLSCINNDIEKAVKGNKAASQRVRTNSIRLEKVGKLYRRESIKWEKSGGAKEVKTKVTDKPASATKAKAKTKAKAVAP